MMDAPPGNSGYYDDENIAVIFAALVCAVLTLVGLLSMVRCVLRRGPHGHMSIRLPNGGMKKAEIKALPSGVFVEAEVADCPVCLTEFARGETVRVLQQCGHSFHVECIDTWLRCHTSCPSCRHSLLDHTAAAPPCDAGKSWVVAIHQSGVADGADASVHVEIPDQEAFRVVPRDSPHRFLP